MVHNDRHKRAQQVNKENKSHNERKFKTLYVHIYCLKCLRLGLNLFV